MLLTYQANHVPFVNGLYIYYYSAISIFASILTTPKRWRRGAKEALRGERSSIVSLSGSSSFAWESSHTLHAHVHMHTYARFPTGSLWAVLSVLYYFLCLASRIEIVRGRNTPQRVR